MLLSPPPTTTSTPVAVASVLVVLESNIIDIAEPWSELEFNSVDIVIVLVCFNWDIITMNIICDTLLLFVGSW